MSGLQLTASLVSSLVWPVVVVVALVLFRRQITTLTAALLARPFTRVKAGPVEVVWDAKTAEVEAQVEAELGGPAPLVGIDSYDADARQRLARVARLAPAAAVVQAFASIETQLRQLLTDAGIDVERATAVQLARRGMQADLLTPETYEAIRGIAVLRNLAAHGHDTGLDPARALEYLALTDTISYTLSQQSRIRTTRAGSETRPANSPDPSRSTGSAGVSSTSITRQH